MYVCIYIYIYIYIYTHAQVTSGVFRPFTLILIKEYSVLDAAGKVALVVSEATPPPPTYDICTVKCRTTRSCKVR